jgi:DNA modification methylase
VSARVEYRRGRSPEALADLPDGCAAAVVTDPPYGTETESFQYGRRQSWAKRGGMSIMHDRDLSSLAGVAPTIARLLCPNGVALVCASATRRRDAEDALMAAGLILLPPLMWDKGRPGISYKVRYAHEEILMAGHPDASPWATRETLISPLRVPPVQEAEHPNEKPVALLRRLIRWACPAGGLVVDPFAGVASCGVAAVAERCSYIGVECDPRWWPVADRRLAVARDMPHPDEMQGSLLGGAA